MFSTLTRVFAPCGLTLGCTRHRFSPTLTPKAAIAVVFGLCMWVLWQEGKLMSGHERGRGILASHDCHCVCVAVMSSVCIRKIRKQIKVKDLAIFPF